MVGSSLKWCGESATAAGLLLAVGAGARTAMMVTTNDGGRKHLRADCSAKYVFNSVRCVNADSQ
jgi:hypothetical protein